MTLPNFAFSIRSTHTLKNHIIFRTHLRPCLERCASDDNIIENIFVMVDGGSSAHRITDLVSEVENFYDVTVVDGDKSEAVVANVPMGLSFRQVAGVEQIAKSSGQMSSMFGVSEVTVRQIIQVVIAANPETIRNLLSSNWAGCFGITFGSETNHGN